MEIKCPACKKVNDGSDECNRCQCDLSGLRRISMAGQRRLTAGSEALRQGKADEALEQAVTSWRLKKSSASAKLAFLACIMLKDFKQATTWYGKAI